MKHAIELLQKHIEVYRVNSSEVPGMRVNGAYLQSCKEKLDDMKLALRVLKQVEIDKRKGTLDKLG